MKPADWILLGLILGYCLWLLLRPKKHGCNGNCCGCSGCKNNAPAPQTGSHRV